jgi:hypothetical protein
MVLIPLLDRGGRTAQHAAWGLEAIDGFTLQLQPGLESPKFNGQGANDAN